MRDVTLCHENVQACATYAPLLSPTGILDGEGNLLPGVQADVTDIDCGDSYIPNKVCSYCLITFDIVDAAGNPILTGLTIRISHCVDCPGIGVIPGNVCINRLNQNIEFCFIPVQDDDGTFRVAVTVGVSFCLVVHVETFNP